MSLTLTARRTLAARQIRVSLAEAEAELATADPDRRHNLEALIDALRSRLNNRRAVVLAARQTSLLAGVYKRLRRARRSPVWGFPATYDPNLMGDRCEICRAVSWVSRTTKIPDYLAWSCSACPSLPTGIPE